MARTGFYPGSFDPVTYGHLDIIARAARLVDRLVLGVGRHHGKKALVDAATRIDLLKTAVPPIAEPTAVKIAAAPFDDLAADAARAAVVVALSRGRPGA